MQLLLTSPESKLHVKDGLFEVLHYNAKGELQKAQHAPALLDSIWLNDGAAVTIAAVRLAMANQIDFVVCDRQGMPEGRLSPLRPSSTSLIQKAQAMVSVTPRGMMFARDWAALKLDRMAEFIEKLAERRDVARQVDSALARIRMGAAQMRELAIDVPHAPPAEAIAATLRGIEGAASRVFYESLSAMLPPQYQFGERSRRPAKDIFNAFLNYGFAVLYRKIEQALVRAGLNAYIGFLHRDGHQFKSLVFDFIEPFRIDMIRAIFGLFSKKRVQPSIHSHTGESGSILLTKEGKTLLLERINKFYDKKTPWQGMNMKRGIILEREAVAFAQSLLAYGAESVPAEDPELFSIN